MVNKMDVSSPEGEVAQTNGQPEPFGHYMLHYFQFRPGWKNVNHGSFGTYPLQIRDVQRKYLEECEAAPDIFMRYTTKKYLDDTRRSLAQLLNAPSKNIVMVVNATTGVNTVMRNITYSEKDVIIYFSTTYGACQNIIMSLVETTQASCERIHLRYPMSDSELLDLFRKTVKSLKDAGKNPRVALFDTIISMPALRMPFESLTALCKEFGILSVVDGAHGVGQIDLDLKKLDPDFFVSNCHKWLFAPRGCAVLYVSERSQKLIRTTFPTSHYFVPQPEPANADGISGVATGGGREKSKKVANPLPPPTGDDTAFTKMFEFVATTDNTPYFCVPAALAFRQKVCGGEEKIRTYCSELAQKAGHRVAEILGTEVLDNKDRSMTRDCAMINVRLPLNVDKITFGDETGPMGIVHWMWRKSFEEFNASIQTFWYEDAFWTRLSGQIYLELSDFEWTASVLKDLCKRVEAGEHLETA